MCNYCYTVFTRSRAIEEFLCGIRFSCRNQQYGCDVFLLHHQMRAHERSCHHEPCFSSSSPTLHRRDVIKFRYGKSFEAPVHKSSVFCCEDYSELFHIVSSREGYGYGTALSMNCIRPDNAWNAEFTYELKMPAGGRRCGTGSGRGATCSCWCC
jgi:E3 ubiquitin-protein ligase SIAH1